MAAETFYQTAIYAVPAFMLADALWHWRRDLVRSLSIYRGTLPEYLLSLTMLMVVVILAAIGIHYAPEFMRWGWMHLIADDGGNVISRGMVETTRYGWTGVLLLWGVWCALILVMPHLVRAEERIFRVHAIAWPAMIGRSLAFGLSHLLVGVPLIVGLVLSFPGLILALIYRRSYLHAIREQSGESAARAFALAHSTRIHAIYNGQALTIMVVLLTLTQMDFPGGA